MKKGYKKTFYGYTWDNPHRRIETELGFTVYKHPQHNSRQERPYPRYRYKITAEYVDKIKIPNDAETYFVRGLRRGYEMGFKEGTSKKKNKIKELK